MQILESSIEQKCRKLAEREKCILLKIQGVKGFMDRILLAPTGLVAFLEFKRPSGTISALQIYYLDKLRRMGHKTGVVYSVEQFQVILQDLLQGRGFLSPIKNAESNGSLPDPKEPCSSLPEWVKHP